MHTLRIALLIDPFYRAAVSQLNDNRNVISQESVNTCKASDCI